jgi:hypothetical protein
MEACHYRKQPVGCHCRPRPLGNRAKEHKTGWLGNIGKTKSGAGKEYLKSLNHNAKVAELTDLVYRQAGALDLGL